MDTNIFIDSKLLTLVTQEINCKKLETPTDDAALKVFVGLDLEFNEKKKKLGYQIIYRLTLNCEENEEEKLVSLEYKAKAIYAIIYKGDNVSAEFKKAYTYFMRELYMTTLEYINNTLFGMKVRFQFPLNLPDGVEVKFKKKK